MLECAEMDCSAVEGKTGDNSSSVEGKTGDKCSAVEGLTGGDCLAGGCLTEVRCTAPEAEIGGVCQHRWEKEGKCLTDCGPAETESNQNDYLIVKTNCGQAHPDQYAKTEC